MIRPHYPPNKWFFFLVGGSFLMLLYWVSMSEDSTTENRSQVSLTKLLNQAIYAAEAGGKLVVSTKDQLEINSKGHTQEGMNDPVTTADFLSHCAMLNTLKQGLPQIKIISEEKDVLCQDFSDLLHSVKKEYDVGSRIEADLVPISDITIWIDPLDATQEYTERLYQYVTTMVCVAVKGQPIIGVIHSPFNGTTSWAWVDQGVSPDLEIKHDVIIRNSKLKIVVSRSHSGSIKELLEMNLKDFELIPAAGAGYKVLQVAKGEADAYLHSTAIKKWDICAGNAILNALGGKMTTKNNDELDYSNDVDVVNRNGLIATHYTDHKLFLNVF